MKKFVVLVALLMLATPSFAIEDVKPADEKKPATAEDKFAPGAAQKGWPRKYTENYINEITKIYGVTGKDPIIYVALDMLKDTMGEFSRQAILGNNLSQRPFKVEFKNLGEIDPNFASFDAIGWKKQTGFINKKDQLHIFINPRHKDAPPGALSALLAHEALHQDEFNSLSEETYAWTMEAATWCEILRLYPESNDTLHPLVKRENTLKKLFERGNYTDIYIKKTVHSNDGYKNLPATSPGFGFEAL